MHKMNVLIYGYGETYQKNVYWINQLYNIVGITDSKFNISSWEMKKYKVEDAVNLAFDIILITSIFFEEIKASLIGRFNIEESKISWFMDEFCNERCETFGEKNPNVIFYIYRAHWQESKNGFYNFFDRAMALYYKTRQLGYELLVDMKNYYTEYSGLDRYGIVNVWEDYYEQPSKYTLDEAYQSKKVILSKFDSVEYNYLTLSKSEYLSCEWWRETYENLGKVTHFTPSQMLKNQINKELNHLKMSGKILGVLARGTDYVCLKPKNHPIPFDTDLLIDECQSKFQKGEYNYIYLATEDLNIFEKFKKSFGENLLFTEQTRVKTDRNKMLIDVKFERENDNYLRGLEYCTAIEVLARCNYLLANCYCYGALGALAIGGGSIKSEILDMGIYD